MTNLQVNHAGSPFPEGAADGGFRLADIVGRSSGLHEVLRRARTVANTDSTVLVHGDTGTGKELVARAVHHWSGRSGSMIKLNIAALPATLVESELFGHERGAFTGAVARRIGRVERAQDGTLFLDEIGEMPLEIQPKLLRFLQDREYERLGGDRPLRSNARLIAATHRNLGAMVDAQRFREDLYYRLNVFPIYMPPLRERREDIPALVQSFVHNYARQMGKSVPAISSATMQRLTSYAWPGNIRELQNVVERAVILAGEDGLQVDIPMREVATPIRPPTTPPLGPLDEVQRGYILKVLEEADWVVGGPKGAAIKLGVNRSTLNYRMKKLGIRRDERRSRARSF
jgi:formate hydrogenlyase transcriptional activator